MLKTTCPVETLNKHFRKLTEASFERYGFAYAELLSQWQAIVGAELAAVSAPERIRWPRRSDGQEDRGQPGGGTLVVRAAEGRALELQYMAPRIIERINGYYGYSAVAKLKVMQGKLPKQSPAADRKSVPVLDEAARAELQSRLQAIGDDKLREALERLGTGALSKLASSRKWP
ncbi:MAG: DciA family protein [Hyphomicrobiales bacterium]|nr:DciA family protein [Hyphomicrobiales bacterium]